MPVILINDDAEYKKVLADNPKATIIVDFSASWCGPCHRIAPVFEQLSDKHTELVFLKVDVDKCPEAAADVKAMPTFRVIRMGKKESEFRGANEQKLRETCAALAR